ncbi:MAG: pilus assembly protein PilM, partial [Verrucomicrobia bacterium]|nr:pilus assembly protein PilM [Verrucomicrobiota bacterium]
MTNQVFEACTKCRLAADRLQLAPIANYNAFESAMRPLFQNGAFMLVDIGHQETRVFAGSRGELVLVRSVEYGGRAFLDAVSNEGAIDREAAVTLVEQGDAGMTETARESLAMLAMELRSSIGFFEGQREQTIGRVHFSGALVNAEMPLQILSDELDMPCDTWDPFASCTVSLPRGKQARFDAERAHLNVACGAALELLQSA